MMRILTTLPVSFTLGKTVLTLGRVFCVGLRRARMNMPAEALNRILYFLAVQSDALLHAPAASSPSRCH